MLQRALVLSLLFAGSVAAATAPKVNAPAAIAHPVALFLKDLSADGSRRITFRASASGTHFFLEEPAGVTVYIFDGTGYTREAFLKNASLSTAMKKYKKR